MMVNNVSASPVTTFGYDTAGNLLQVTDPRNNTTSYTYDALNRKVTTTQPQTIAGNPASAPVNSVGYDLDGNVVISVDPRQHATTFEYDGLNRKVTSTQPHPDNAELLAAPVSSVSYDPVGNVLSTTDPLNQVTRFSYDAMNRKVTETKPAPDDAVLHGVDPTGASRPTDGSGDGHCDPRQPNQLQIPPRKSRTVCNGVSWYVWECYRSESMGHEHNVIGPYGANVKMGCHRVCGRTQFSRRSLPRAIFHLHNDHRPPHSR